MATASSLLIAVKVRFVCVVVVYWTVYVIGLGALCVCCCCVSDHICVWALILLRGFTVTHVLVTSLFVLSVEACVSLLRHDLVARCARVRARVVCVRV